MNNAIVLTAALIGAELPPFLPDEDPKLIAAEAFRVVLSRSSPNFLLTREDDLFKAGVGALVLRWAKLRPDLVETVQAEMAALGALSAAQAGVPVDMGAALAALDGREALGLLGLFREAERLR